MKFGFCAPNYGKTASVDIIVRSTLAAEKLGFDSVWLTDHVLIPRESGTPYERVFETITTLGHLSALTAKIKLGISSLVLPIRNPIVVAKQISNLDVLSMGRTMICVSSGWSQKEYDFLGSNFHDRGRRLDDSITLMRALWSGMPSFKGAFVKQNFADAVLDPKPVQQSIPVWIGGLSEKAMERAVKLGDAWHPNAHPLDEFKPMVARFRKIQGAENKEICVRISLNAKLESTRFVDEQGKERVAFCASKQENRKLLEEFEQLGATYLVVVPGSLPFFAGELFDRENRVVENLETFAGQMMK